MNNVGFKIGHDSTKSETFIPNYQVKADSKIMFIDIAGLKDTGGILIDTLNCIFNKMVFSLCNNIKMMIPITMSSI